MKIPLPFNHLYVREGPENGLTFIGPEDAMQAEKEESSVVLAI